MIQEMCIRDRVYAYLQDTQAEEYFEQALAQFDEKSIDYNITLSYFCLLYTSCV